MLVFHIIFHFWLCFEECYNLFFYYSYFNTCLTCSFLFQSFPSAIISILSYWSWFIIVLIATSHKMESSHFPYNCPEKYKKHPFPCFSSCCIYLFIDSASPSPLQNNQVAKEYLTISLIKSPEMFLCWNNALNWTLVKTEGFNSETGRQVKVSSCVWGIGSLTHSAEFEHCS